MAKSSVIEALGLERAWKPEEMQGGVLVSLALKFSERGKRRKYAGISRCL